MPKMIPLINPVDPIAEAALAHHENVRAAIEALSLSSVLAVVARRYRDKGKNAIADALCDAMVDIHDIQLSGSK